MFLSRIIRTRLAARVALAVGASVYFVLNERWRPPSVNSMMSNSKGNSTMTTTATYAVTTAVYASPRLLFVGTLLSVYFAVASVTALFITLVNFLLLDPTPSFFNMTAHLFWIQTKEK